MSKISDNASEGSYQADHVMGGGKKKQQFDKFRKTNQGQLGANNSVGGMNELKIDGGKSHSFPSDMEEYSTAAGGTVPVIGGQQQALPPIIMPMKVKGGKKKQQAPGMVGAMH